MSEGLRILMRAEAYLEDRCHSVDLAEAFTGVDLSGLRDYFEDGITEINGLIDEVEDAATTSSEATA